MKENDIIIFGAGGQAKVVFDIIQKQKQFNVVAFVSTNNSLTSYLGVPHCKQEEWNSLNCKKGLVAIGDNYIREKIVKMILLLCPDFTFISAVHPSVQIGQDVNIETGTVIMAGASINSGTRIGKHCIINTGTNVDHDCKIFDYASIAPGCTLGGNVQIGIQSVISLGANIIHSKKIGEHVLIGAGSTVISDIEDYSVAYGVPCKVVRQRQPGEKYL